MPSTQEAHERLSVQGAIRGAGHLADPQTPAPLKDSRCQPKWSCTDSSSYPSGMGWGGGESPPQIQVPDALYGLACQRPLQVGQTSLPS